MSLKDKSDFNFDSIDVLQKADLHSPVVHCAYYGVLQLCIHALYSFHDKTEKEIDVEIHSVGSSHKYYIDKMMADAFGYEKEMAVQISEEMNKLKRHRNRADYYNDSFDRPKADAVKSIAYSLKQNITKLYNF